MSEWSYLLIEECLYSMCKTVICLVPVPIVEESGEFGGNLRNYHRSYLNRISVPQQSMKNLVHSSPKEWTHPFFIKDRWDYHGRLCMCFLSFVEFIQANNYDDGQVFMEPHPSMDGWVNQGDGWVNQGRLDNQWIYLPRPEWPFNGRDIWTNIWLGAFFLTPSHPITHPTWRHQSTIQDQAS